MGMSLAAFACLLVGIRGSRLGLFFSALLAGVLPWVMVQSGLVSLGLAALVMFGDSSLRRTERLTWLSITALPSVAIISAFFFWGPFDTFVRTVFLAPFGVIEAGIGKDWSFPWGIVSELPGSLFWRIVYVLVLIVGAMLFRSAARHAPSGSPIQYAAFLIVPVSVGFLVMAFIRPLPSPEYFIEVAPATALFAAIVAAKLWRWRVWDELRVPCRVSSQALRTTAVACLGAALAFPFDPWEKQGVGQTPLPPAYCDSAVHWIKRLGPGRTVLDLSGTCGRQIFGSGESLPSALYLRWQLVSAEHVLG